MGVLRVSRRSMNVASGGSRTVLIWASVTALPVPVAAGAVDERLADLTGQPLPVADRVVAPKPATGRPVRSDPELLRASSNEITPVLVKLDYDAVAAYAGGIPGLAAAGPSVTGRRLDVGDPVIAAYEEHLAGWRRPSQWAWPRPSAGIDRHPAAHGVRRCGRGLPADRAKTVTLPGVLAVRADTRNQLLDDDGGSPGRRSVRCAGRHGGRRARRSPHHNRGCDRCTRRCYRRGTIVAVLDSGAWPEHPSFADPGLPAPPAKADGSPGPARSVTTR